MELAITIQADDDNPVLGDLYLGSTGQEVVLTELRDEVAQRTVVRFRFFRGDWAINLNAGTPWFQYLLRKGLSDSAIRALLTTVVLTDVGVSAVTSLSYTVNKATRHFKAQIKAKLADGTVLRSAEFGDFVIPV